MKTILAYSILSLAGVVVAGVLVCTIVAMVRMVATNEDGAGMAAFTLLMLAAGVIGNGVIWAVRHLKNKS